MPRGRPLTELSLTVEDRATLERFTRRRRTGAGLAQRSRIVLLAADGLSNREVANHLGCHQVTVGKWRQRFIDAGVAGLLDEPRPGRPRSVTDDEIDDIVVTVLEEKPPGEATHWSTRDMARRVGVSQSETSEPPQR